MGLYVLHLHLHGLLRGRNPELGRDADTGGQTTYVLELARALAARPDVDQVEVITRLIRDPRVGPDYARPLEPVQPGLAIRRLPFGPAAYLPKEQLWTHLDPLVELLCTELQSQPRLPDWIHAHYADAGYVGAELRRRLGIPLLFTAHSLGREKRRRLRAAGYDDAQLEELYAISHRIGAEEQALAHSDLVITSTRQEQAGQYACYTHFRSEDTRVIAPGVDTTQFYPPSMGAAAEETPIHGLMAPFLRDPSRPPLLAICRADPRKNIPALVEVFGASERLRRDHNLVLVLGCRHDPAQLDQPQRDLFQQVFALVDRFDLYGSVAYPKQHQRAQIPALYRWAARRGGVFVNPALTEPFGLTLLEAAASGLPVVATDDGGPRDILARCRHGLLADVGDPRALQLALEQSLASPHQWQRWRQNGLAAVRLHYSWQAHVERYLTAACPLLIPRSRRSGRPPACRWPGVERGARAS